MNVGLLGIGNWGKNYLRALREISGIRLFAVAASSAKNKDLVPEGIKFYEGAEFLFKDENVAAIVIATPPSTHFEMIKLALAAGKHVLVEKPMTVSMKEAENLRAVVKNSGKVFMVALQYPYNDYMAFVKKMINGGELGEILSISSTHSLSPKRLDVGIFWDASPHAFSIRDYLFGPGEIVSAKGKNTFDAIEMKIKFREGPEMFLSESFFGDEKVRKTVIIGTKRTVTLDETKTEKKLMLSNPDEFPDIAFREPLKTELECFRDCILTGASPITNFDFGFRNVGYITDAERLTKGG